MAEQAVISSVHIFHVLFLDENQQPLVVADPTITIFAYSLTGVKQVLVADAAMTAVAGDVGRYSYVYTIPGTFDHGDILFATMVATDPAFPLARLVEETTVNIIAAAPSSPNGLIPRFVKGG